MSEQQPEQNQVKETHVEETRTETTTEASEPAPTGDEGSSSDE